MRETEGGGRKIPVSPSPSHIPLSECWLGSATCALEQCMEMLKSPGTDVRVNRPGNGTAECRAPPSAPTVPYLQVRPPGASTKGGESQGSSLLDAAYVDWVEVEMS